MLISTENLMESLAFPCLVVSLFQFHMSNDCLFICVQTAFRVKAKEFHPDQNQDNKGRAWLSIS